MAIKPIILNYRGSEVRITHIKRRKLNNFSPKSFQYNFNLSLKKSNDIVYQFKKLKLDANDKEDLEFEIRLLLNELNL